VRSTRGFQFHDLGIGAVMKSYRLRVPPYQREYAWTDEEVKQLYTDLANAKLDSKDYFLGTIVTITTGEANPLEIVDGQQRLTTTAILLAAIRDHLAALGSAELIVESINNEFLNTIDRAASARVAKLTLNIDDNEFFSRLIAGGNNAKGLAPTRNSHDLLLGAAKIAREWVQGVVTTLAENDHPALLNDWLSYLEFGASVVLLKTQNGAQAFKMFETLNDRGLKTSQADLVKSYLFGQSGARIPEAQSRWSSMMDNLEEIEEDNERAINFLRHAFIATRRFVRAEDVYDATNRDIRGEANSVAFLTELERLSRAYVATYRADSNHWSGHPQAAIKALRIFNKFDIKPMRPLILAVALKFSTAFRHQRSPCWSL
jgi:uncharacterized protein with ParB-like and HNH nuclease domain